MVLLSQKYKTNLSRGPRAVEFGVVPQNLIMRRGLAGASHSWIMQFQLKTEKEDHLEGLTSTLAEQGRLPRSSSPK